MNVEDIKRAHKNLEAKRRFPALAEAIDKAREREAWGRRRRRYRREHGMSYVSHPGEKYPGQNSDNLPPLP